ncbi:hypothetical protein GQ44DRAFT_768248 [Phaeosphaeriaceae sp. PMI808]|nr:hypothetical protein GQ44DRAFT_768248 [Phaeosphaeriaceae sp. PMI808]
MRPLVDECHRETTGMVMTKYMDNVRTQLRTESGRRLKVWGASGTPDRSGAIKSMRFLVQVLGEDRAWQGIPKDDVLHPLTLPEVNNMEKLVDKLKRKCLTTKWFDGEQIVGELPRRVDQSITCTPTQAEAAVLVQWEGQAYTEQEDAYQKAVEEWKANSRKGPEPTKGRPVRAIVWGKDRLGYRPPSFFERITFSLSGLLTVAGSLQGNVYLRLPAVVLRGAFEKNVWSTRCPINTIHG